MKYSIYVVPTNGTNFKFIQEELFKMGYRWSSGAAFKEYHNNTKCFVIHTGTKELQYNRRIPEQKSTKYKLITFIDIYKLNKEGKI